MKTIKDFLIARENRIPNKQYLYVRIEGNGDLNNGTTSQYERYSKKTQPREEHWIDVSSFMDTNPSARPDDIFHKFLEKSKNWHHKGSHRDIFENKSVADLYSAFIDFYNYRTAKKIVKGPISLREYQKDGAQFLIDFIEGNLKTALFECITGYGKTISTFYALNATKIPSVCIVSSRNLVGDAFIKDFQDFNLENQDMCLITKDETYGDEKSKTLIRMAPSFRNKVFESAEDDSLWIIDEAHLSANGIELKKFLKNKKVIYITATGNKLNGKCDTSYYFGISDMVDALENGLVELKKFPIPNFELSTEFAHYDFGKLLNYPPENQMQLMDKFLEDNKGQNAIVVAQGKCENGCKLFKISANLHPEIKWYVATDGKNSESYVTNHKGQQIRVKSGKDAIHHFDEDCENEKTITHILITVFQGRESYSYYDLHNVGYFSATSSVETFFQLLGRLMREKKNSGSTTAKFFLYCPFINFCSILQEQFKQECEKRGESYDQKKFDQFVRVFHITVDGMPKVLTAQDVIETISVRGSITKNCIDNDWDLLCDIFDGTSTGIMFSGITGSRETFYQPPVKEDDIDDDSEEQQKQHRTNKEHTGEPAQNRLDVKQKFEQMIERMPFYFKWLESKGKFHWPTKREDFLNLSYTLFSDLVYDFNGTEKVIRLFKELSDGAIETLIKKLTIQKNDDILDMPYAYYSTATKRKCEFDRVNFNHKEVQKIIATWDKNVPICLVRFGPKVYQRLVNAGFQVMYFTDILAETKLLDMLKLQYNKVSIIDGKEDWITTMNDYDFSNVNFLMNPPFFGEKPEGKRRTGEHLYNKIWYLIRNKYPKAKIAMIGPSRFDQDDKAGFTSIQKIDFEGTVGIGTNIYSYVPGEKQIKIIKKYDENGMHDFVKENSVKNSLRSICANPDWDGETIPKGYIGLNDRSTQFNGFLPGEKVWKNESKGKLYKTIQLLKTSDPEGLLKYLKKYAEPEYSDYLKKYGMGHIFRGFDKTFKIPKKFIKE